VAVSEQRCDLFRQSAIGDVIAAAAFYLQLETGQVMLQGQCYPIFARKLGDVSDRNFNVGWEDIHPVDDEHVISAAVDPDTGVGPAAGAGR